MIKRTTYFLCALLCAASAGCGDDSDVYYTKVYDITEIGARITTRSASTPGEGTDSGTDDETDTGIDDGTDTGTDGGTDTGTDGGTDTGDNPDAGDTPDNPDTPDTPDEASVLQDLIAADIAARAPVQPGGSYRLDYSEYNGGRLEVTKTPGAEALSGVFLRQPGSSALQLFYGGEEEYTCTVERNANQEQGTNCALLTVDLTEHYREQFGELYPDIEIVQVLRCEYTDAPYRE